MQQSKREANAKQLMLFLEVLRRPTSIAVSEGKHDTAVWSELGVRSVSVPQLFAGGVGLRGMTAYIAMDLDKAGEEKARKAVAYLRERHPSTRVNETLVSRMLKMLGVTCVEQMRKPVAELTGSESGTSKKGGF
jgi:hypothetical protein